MKGVKATRLGRTVTGKVLGAALCAVALSACGLIGGGGEPEIAADVEGTKITSDQVDLLYDIFAKTDAGQESLEGVAPGSLTVDPKQVRATSLSYQIKVVFLDFLAKREGVTIPDDPEKDEVYEGLASIGSLQVSGYRGQDLKVAARIEAISKAIATKLLPEVTITDAELQAAYDERKDVVGKSFRATTDVAFMASEASAAALKAELDKGKDFVEATDALGDETLAAQTVDINPITPIQADIISTVRKLDVGKTADPVRYDVDGATLFVVLHQQKRTDLPALTLKEATPELTKIVIDHKRFLVFQDWLKRQYMAAKIDVDGYYGTWNPSFQAVV